jgi:adenosine deaminase
VFAVLLQMLQLHAKNQAIPIEICPTSNLITLGHDGYDEHPYLSQWLALGYPISINTDDRGIFNTTLTQELLVVKDAYRLDLADIVRILGTTMWLILGHVFGAWCIYQQIYVLFVCGCVCVRLDH